ncbi:unnamed protein product [Pleuronectes platessa]|uniref:Uncharacterized protein n=1 Tax=Pleuronectes platessa TaxID=8262 RepID=A0A9N7UB46_PLEPL|nr:unnamed protein product [Pleuronectes platessa]
MDKVERVMKMVKRMSPRKKRREGGGGGRGGGGGPGELESPDTLCDELCRFSLCISGSQSSSYLGSYLRRLHPGSHTCLLFFIPRWVNFSGKLWQLLTSDARN